MSDQPGVGGWDGIRFGVDAYIGDHFEKRGLHLVPQGLARKRVLRWSVGLAMGIEAQNGVVQPWFYPFQ